MANVVWTEAERNFIRRNAGVITDEEGARQLSVLIGRPVTLCAYRKQRQKLKIVKNKGRGVCRVNKVATVQKGGNYHETSQDGPTQCTHPTPTGVPCTCCARTNTQGAGVRDDDSGRVGPDGRTTGGTGTESVSDEGGSDT